MKSIYYIRCLMRTIVRIGITGPEGLNLRMPRGFPERECGTLQVRRLFPLSGLFLGFCLALAACGEMPAARTNWGLMPEGAESYAKLFSATCIRP